MQHVSFEPFSINQLLKFKIMSHLEAIQAVSMRASKEYSLEKALEKMMADWEGVGFVTVPYKDSGTYIIGGVDEIQALLDDQIVKVQSMRASPFIKQMEATAATWHDMLNTLQVSRVLTSTEHTFPSTVISLKPVIPVQPVISL